MANMATGVETLAVTAPGEGSSRLSDLGLSAPPGIRTRNLRIKRLSMCLSGGFWGRQNGL